MFGRKSIKMTGLSAGLPAFYRSGDMQVEKDDGSSFVANVLTENKEKFFFWKRFSPVFG